MKFFRPARKEDFDEYEIEYDHHLFMEEEIKKLIENGEMTNAVSKFNKKTGIGFFKAKGFCEEYQKYLQAKNDFENGKEVFVPY